ncbi:cupin (plasmid) [Paraburkholderia sp. PGU19]|uniref:2,4'-dihydroxyacetophenone dioxygenase family protein n=1 Tax=Paraburkholderia sp. PGU19 TaxID=2735434 RepID=UPI0015DB9728|nr:2,4'-dihydroxyacetophenone dioxygenase family protein [Paraburkholderia sp. PGU19]BCG02643.1 cupin [Paraburkholderia sp. PGU19]
MNPRKPDENAIPYQLAQPQDMTADLVHLGVLDTYLQDDNLWVPTTSTVSFKPLLLNASQGYYVNLLRVRQSGVLSRHRHTGPVHALVLKGRWYYLEHEWIAEQGSYAHEPAGETHTLYVPEDVTEMITWFHVTGGYTYVDPEGVAVGYEDVFTKIDAARKHYESIGLGADYVKRLIR